ncbi:kelch domain-containing protein 10-like [Cimex lectularius]|uniref:Kelch domain-containing protein 10 n=1 Tax=Cimex lectularius TaxID=79782 RepID=A0A8I6RIV3_CIMLE|nr:kelch domain-containing protein 10-like [Cimex lectularius]
MRDLASRVKRTLPFVSNLFVKAAFKIKQKAKRKRKKRIACPRRKMEAIEESTLYAFKPFVYTYYNRASKRKPAARSGHRIVCNDNYLYLFGGYNPNIVTTVWGPISMLLRELWRLNLSTGNWELLPVENIPKYVASSSVILTGDVLLVYGGSGVPFGANSSNKLFVCDLSLDVLEFTEVLTVGTSPIPGYGQACFLQDGKLFVFGGTTGYTYWSDIGSLDIRTNCWETEYTCVGLENEPRGRYRHELGNLHNKTFVLGGGTSDHSFGFTEINVYSHEDKSWLAVPASCDPEQNDYPLPRRYHSSVQSDDKIFIFGGIYNKRALQDTWSLDLNTLQWTCVRSLYFPYPTFFHDSCLTPSGKVYTFGGVSTKELVNHSIDGLITKEQVTERSADLYSAWICIPSLKEIAWEAVLFYRFHENEHTKALIPTPFRDRLIDKR